MTSLADCKDLDSFLLIVRKSLSHRPPEVIESACGLVERTWNKAVELERQRATLENIKSIASKIAPRQPTVRKIIEPGEFEIQYSTSPTISDIKYSYHYANDMDECINFIKFCVLPYYIKYINKSTGLSVSLSILDYKYENIIVAPAISENDLIDELNKENERNLQNET